MSISTTDLHHFSALPPSDCVITPILPKHQLRTEYTDSAHELASSISGWQQIYHQLTPGEFSGSLQELWLDGIQVYWEHSTNALAQSCVIWPKAFWFGISPTTDVCEETICEQLLPQNIAMAGGAKEFELFIPNDFSMMGLVIEEKLLLDSLVVATECDQLDQIISQTQHLAIGIVQKHELRTLLMHILALGQKNPQYLVNPVVIKTLQHSILDSLTNLDFMPNQSDRPIVKRRYSELVTKARDYILGHPYESLTVLDLVQYLKVSRRTLQNCFLNTLGVTPLNYLKAMRLNAVRRELESEYSPYTTVQDVAMSWGFWHLSQFSVDYRNFFGIKPSQSLQRRGCVTQRWRNQCAQ